MHCPLGAEKIIDFSGPARFEAQAIDGPVEILLCKLAVQVIFQETFVRFDRSNIGE
jgi:hypothetical protein